MENDFDLNQFFLLKIKSTNYQTIYPLKLIFMSNFEEEHVQQVYEAIAPHFSATRYKRWPIVDKFIKALPKGSFGCDFGCGNGKNLEWDPLGSGCMTIGMDACNGLLGICKERGFEVILGTVLKDPFRSEIFDFSLSIAVIHHLRSAERRLVAIKEMLRVMKKGGEGLIFVWAFEDNKSVRRHKNLKIIDGNEQDVLVPWSIKEFSSSSGKLNEKEKEKGMDLNLINAPNQDRDRDRYSDNEDNLHKRIKTSPIVEDDSSNKINNNNSFERFYHLFKKGELDELVERADGVILESGYDRDNWYIKFQK